MSDELIDDLVADIIDQAGRHIRVSQEAIERLTTQYPALVERYGDWSLGISFASIPLRREVHKALRAKNMSVRQIAAQTGVPRETVRRDVAEQPDPDGSVASTQPDPDGSPQEHPADEAPEAEPVEQGPGPLWKPLDQELRAIRRLSDTPATEVAASVPADKRLTTAKRLRALGSYLGAIATKLEDFS